MRQGRLARARSAVKPVRRSRTLVASVLGVALALFAAGLWISSDDSVPYRGGPLTITTGVGDGVYHQYGKLLEPRLAADLRTDVTLMTSQGSPDNLDRVLRGDATLGIATADAVAALPPEQKEQLRAIARLYDDFVQLVVPKGSRIKSLADLRPAPDGTRLRVGIGPPRSGVQLLTRRILKTVGMNPETHLDAQDDGLGAAAAKLVNGELDAFFWSGGLPTKAVSDIVNPPPDGAGFEIQFVKLDGVAQALQNQPDIAEPQVYREAVIPGDAYRNVGGVATVAVPNLMVTRADADPELIRRVTGTVLTSRQAIGAVVHAAQLVDPGTAIFTFPPLRLHEGARLWYRSAKP
ncbi:TAXI family TRAP transporter solute-binding subunit [Yinghuangia sp. YIM S09857]|uniref:TAXI family TRAP transporter solute-binding subunit n=1 Tax=Yinghuangia sp. YIM S09857 TaxID=3436929 RepID=UPI003F53224D